MVEYGHLVNMKITVTLEGNLNGFVMTLSPMGLSALALKIFGAKWTESPLKLDKTQAYSLTNRYLKEV